MSGFPRVSRDNDPRRSKKDLDNDTPSEKPARSYGQSAPLPEREQGAIEDFEDLTDEPVREGDNEPAGDAPSGEDRKKARQLREFEDLAGEPVFDDEEKKQGE